MRRGFKVILCNNNTKLMNLMQEIEGDFKLSLLRSKGF